LKGREKTKDEKGLLSKQREKTWRFCDYFNSKRDNIKRVKREEGRTEEKDKEEQTTTTK